MVLWPAFEKGVFGQNTPGLIGLKTTKLLDFLHFDLTNPMVPNLSNEFLSVWVSGTVS